MRQNYANFHVIFAIVRFKLSAHIHDRDNKSSKNHCTRKIGALKTSSYGKPAREFKNHSMGFRPHIQHSSIEGRALFSFHRTVQAKRCLYNKGDDDYY